VQRCRKGALVIYDNFRGWTSNEEGSLVKIADSERNNAYIIIQEFIILANTIMADFMAKNNLPNIKLLKKL